MQPELQTANTGYGTVAIASDSQKVLRNTYMLLALTMVPTSRGRLDRHGRRRPSSRAARSLPRW